MTSKKEFILEAYERALEEESKRHEEVMKKAKEICFKALKEERQGTKGKASDAGS